MNSPPQDAPEILAFDPEAIHRGNRGLDIDEPEVATQVQALLERMTPAQKFNQIRGLQAQPRDGLYLSGGDDYLGIPALRMVDGPRGARAGHATAFPVAIARAASFNVDLERRVGLAIGLEVAAKGGNVLLAPTINLLRHPGWGRAQETYSEDSFHTGAMGSAFIGGAQNHVLASPKHFAANNVELTRFEISANLPARVLHEVYLPHFKRCVIEAGAASVMSAYNKLNHVYCGEHPILLTDILRVDWGFTGFVESDWFLGTRSTAAALRAGMDIEMPAPYRFTDDNLIEALQAGDLSEADLDQAVSHVLQRKLGWKLSDLPVPPAAVVECTEHLALAREAAEQSLVLLKNKGILPIADSVRRIAVVGDLADQANLGDRGSSCVRASHVVTPLEGLRAHASDREITYLAANADLTALADFDLTVVVAGLTYREEGEYIPTQQQEAEGDELARGGDREDLDLPESQRVLIEQAARHARHTVVVLEGGSAVLTEGWVDHVDALLYAWYPGCQGGHAIARVLFGAVCPSGRLPVTIPRTADQLVPFDPHALELDHELLPGYKHLDAGGFEPAFPFGFGLSYTSFKLNRLVVQRRGEGFRITVAVHNTGKVPGAAVVQLYAGYPRSEVARPVRELKGFGRVHLDPGSGATLAMDVADADLCWFHPTEGWQLESTDYRFDIGFSSRELPLTTTWRLSDGAFRAL